MQIRRRLLDTAQRKRIDRSLRRDHHSAFHARLEETFDREVVHLVVGVERRLVTNAALSLPEEQVFTANFTLRRSHSIQTSKQVRYRYEAGSEAPSGEPEVLATFPDYGLGYKYGGWHLTRTVAVGEVIIGRIGRTPLSVPKVYVAVGSSCNACEEKEEVRATIVEMDLDGKNQRYYARGLRNAVGLKWVKGRLWATNMGSDHLGDHRPADTFYAIEAEKNYGWPYCFQAGAKILSDPKFNLRNKKFDCRKVPAAHNPFPAHSSPLGLEYFDSTNDPALANSFLVALHGSTKRRLRRGYTVVKIQESGSGTVEDFITGFFDGTNINGRPADVFSFGKNAFLVTDDHSGVVYYIHRKS